MTNQAASHDVRQRVGAHQHGGPIVSGADDGAKKWIYALILTYAVIEFVRPQYYVPALGVVRPALITSVLLILMWVKTYGLGIFRDPLIRKVLILWLLTAMMIPFASNNFAPYQLMQQFGNFVLCATIPIALLFSQKGSIRRFLYVWVAIHCYLAIFALTHSGLGPGSFLTDENDLALTLSMCFPYALLLAHTPNQSALQKYVLLAAAALLAAGVVITGSRGGFVGFAAIIAFLLWHSRNKIRNLVLLALLGAASLLVVPDSYVEEMLTISDEGDETRQERMLYWRIGWKIFTENPIIGVGAGNYPFVAGDYQMMLDDYVPGDRLETGRVAHSVYFTLLPEYGLAGSTVFLLLIIGAFRRLSARGPPTGDREHDDDHYTALAVRASLIGFLTAGAFISVLFYPQLWFTLGFAAAVRPHQRAAAKS